MAKFCYEAKSLGPEALHIAQQADKICQEYAKQGYDLTVRGLYYKFIARDLFPESWRRTWVESSQKWVRDPHGTKNNDVSYNKLCKIVGDGRMAGLIDWDHIIDRTRNIRSNSHWAKPSDLIKHSIDQYALDKWEDQENYVEVWVEKDALLGVVGRKCLALDVPFFSCRGYTSLSEVWGASQRLLHQIERNKQVHIIHMGDHDASGIDMSRDIKDRLSMFVSAHCGEGVHVQRVALNMPQILRLNPPPSPTKLGDSRAARYIELYGHDCWELDALEPVEIDNILDRAVGQFRDETKWKKSLDKETKGRRTLEAIYEEFPAVVSFLKGDIV